MKNDNAFQEVKDTFFFFGVIWTTRGKSVVFFSLVRTLSASGNNMCKERFCFALALAGSQVFGFQVPG